MSFSSFAFQKLFDVSECKINDQERLLRHKNTDICLTIQESQSNVSYSFIIEIVDSASLRREADAYLI